VLKGTKTSGEALDRHDRPGTNGDPRRRNGPETIEPVMSGSLAVIQRSADCFGRRGITRSESVEAHAKSAMTPG
jgi:hypothetical protein